MSADDDQTFSGLRCELCGVVRMNSIYSHHGVVRCQDHNICEQVTALVQGARSSFGDLLEAGWKPETSADQTLSDEEGQRLLDSLASSDPEQCVRVLMGRILAERVAAAEARGEQRVRDAVEAVLTDYAVGKQGPQSVRNSLTKRVRAALAAGDHTEGSER